MNADRISIPRRTIQREALPPFQIRSGILTEESIECPLL